MKPRPPLLGYNHNVRHEGRLFHVQTEDSGTASPHIFTHLFAGGVIVASKRTNYPAEEAPPAVRERMQRQHKAMLKELRAGSFGEKIAQQFPAPEGVEGVEGVPLELNESAVTQPNLQLPFLEFEDPLDAGLERAPTTPARIKTEPLPRPSTARAGVIVVGTTRPPSPPPLPAARTMTSPGSPPSPAVPPIRRSPNPLSDRSPSGIAPPNSSLANAPAPLVPRMVPALPAPPTSERPPSPPSPTAAFVAVSKPFDAQPRTVPAPAPTTFSPASLLPARATLPDPPLASPGAATAPSPIKPVLSMGPPPSVPREPVVAMARPPLLSRPGELPAAIPAPHAASRAPSPFTAQPSSEIAPPPPARRRRPTVSLESRQPPSYASPRPTPIHPAAQFASGPSADGAVVARPAVIVGVSSTTPARGAAPSIPLARRGPSENIFGADLVSEKSLDEVILAYLADEPPAK